MHEFREDEPAGTFAGMGDDSLCSVGTYGNGRLGQVFDIVMLIVSGCDSKSTALTGVRVRLSLRAPNKTEGYERNVVTFLFWSLLGVHIGVYVPFFCFPRNTSQFPFGN